MNLIASFSHNGQPQRQLVTHEGRTYRRLLATFKPSTGEIDLVFPSPIWQEQIHTGEFHNLMTGTVALEAAFIEMEAVARRLEGGAR